MKTLTEHLSQYAEYHRDRRNILTHFVGIPMIVLSVTLFLSMVSFPLLGLSASLAWVAVLAASIYYLRLDLRYGLAMAVVLVLCIWLSEWVVASGTALWVAIGLFVIGWAFQFLGHAYEQRKPAFVDDLAGLIIGPLFVMAELGFHLGLRKTLEQDIEKQVGPTLIRPKKTDTYKQA